MDVCDPLLEGGNAYSATMTASLTPPPATQQVVIYRLEGNWFLYAEGYRWNGSLVETRRNDVRISDADAAAIEGSRHAARQHSCAGQTELTRTAALFKEMALKYDPAFEGYLSGL